MGKNNLAITPFRAFVCREENGKFSATVSRVTLEDLSAGEVVIQAAYSSINFKDALGGLNKGRIFKKFPIVPGIDVSGTVVQSSSRGFSKGDKVLVNGSGLGEVMDGGYAEYVRVPANAVVPLPKGLSLETCMVLGTAGFTAALALHRMETNGQSPKHGPVLVTGASGGVGSFAVSLFSTAGYEVWAVSGKSEAQSYLKSLGADRVIAPQDLTLGKHPLEKALYGGVVDNVGGQLLSGLLPCVHLWGNVACIGLAGGAELQSTVMPLILRGVSLLGISSNNTAPTLRQKLWKKLGKTVKQKHLKIIHQKTLSLDDLEKGFHLLLERKCMGRILVKIR